MKYLIVYEHVNYTGDTIYMQGSHGYTTHREHAWEYTKTEADFAINHHVGFAPYVLKPIEIVPSPSGK